MDRSELVALFDAQFYHREERVLVKYANYRMIPDSLETRFDWLKLHSQEWSIPQPFYTQVPDVELRGRRCLAFKGARIILESSLNSLGYLSKSGDAKYAYWPWLFSKGEPIQIALSLVNILSRNYYHWLCEILPSVEAYFQYFRKTGQKAKVIIDQDAPEFQTATLLQLGIEEENIIKWTNKRTKVSELIVVSSRYLAVGEGFWASGFILSKGAFDWLRDRYLQEGRTKSRNIYISRRDAKGRRVVNDEELQEFLTSKGFETVTLSGMNFKDQVQLFQEANCIMTVHGAALANTIFATKLRVIEFFPSKRKANSPSIYFQIGFYYDHKYWVMECEQVNDDEDIRVDIDKLEKVLDEEVLIT